MTIFRIFSALILSLPMLAFGVEPVLTLDASEAKSLQIVDGKIERWTAGATQTEADRRPVIGPKLGEMPTITFDGNDFLEGPAVLAEGDDTFTIIAIWRPEREGVQVVFEQAGDGGGRRGSLLQVGKRYGFNGQGNDAHSLVAIQPKQWRLTAMMLTGTERDNVVIVDNDNPPAIGTVNMEAQNLGVRGIRIGNKLTSNGEFFQGQIAEIRVFSDALSKADLVQQLQELKTKWKLDFKTQVPEIVAKNEPEPAPVAIPEEPTEEQITFFETHVRPVLADNCYSCHSADEKQKGGLLVDSLAALLEGGDSGPAVVPGKPDESPLFRGVSYLDSEFAMPPKKKLPDLAIENLRKWIEMGAPWPGGATELAKQEETWDWEALRSGHWAWQPISKADPPAVKNEAWVTNDLDRFVLAKLEAEGLTPSEPAPKHTLIRRVYLDLIGLPPTPQQTVDFVEGRVSWSDVIEQLLADPRYGERWARHWLDVARYSEGYGGFLDKGEHPQAWRYRDWVVQAINDDMPIDQFVRLQIAGDLIDPDKHTVATGFFALGPRYVSDGGDPDSKAMAEIETLDDRVDTLGRGILGVTLACARCHDHKFDPFPTLDYYSIAGVFKNSPTHEHPIVPQSVVDAYNAAQQHAKDFEKAMNDFIQEHGNVLLDQEATRLTEYFEASVEFKQLQPRPDPQKWARERGLAGTVFRFCFDPFGGEKKDGNAPALDAWFESRSTESVKQFQAQVVALRAKEKPETDEEKKLQGYLNRVFKFDRNQVADDLYPEIADAIRAKQEELKEIKAELPAKYATVHSLRDAGAGNMKVALRGNLRKPGEEAPRRFLRIFEGELAANFTEGSGRLELADAVVSPANPLTARVFVNRVWGWHFGKALVPSRSNFGELGLPPAHPQLLDFLAAEFTNRSWSLKELHRLILNSSVWRQSSQFDPDKFAKDGDNQFLWRMNPRKLEVEAWRDQLLAVTGELDLAMGGEPLDNLESSMRRTLYAKTSRNGDKFASDHFLALFDFPPPRTSIAKRTPTITPQQSLFLLNNDFFRARARALARRLESEAAEPAERVDLAYRLLFAREPTSEEREIGLAWLDGDSAAAERYAQALLASNEFMFVE